jgi:hypothetical protein
VTDFGVETITLDLPPLVGALSRRLRDAGLPVTPARAADFARAVSLVEPITRRALLTARAVFLSDAVQVEASTRCSSRSSAVQCRLELRPADGRLTTRRPVVVTLERPRRR